MKTSIRFQFFNAGPTFKYATYIIISSHAAQFQYQIESHSFKKQVRSSSATNNAKFIEKIQSGAST